MPKVCNNTSVGMLIRNRAGEYALNERKKPPYGFAPSAGHMEDNELPIMAAYRELFEELGINPIGPLALLVAVRKENPCRRQGGTYHNWWVYSGISDDQIKRSEDETKQAGWYSVAQIAELAQKTEAYLAKQITEEDWQKSPGLELVWYEFLKELKII